MDWIPGWLHGVAVGAGLLYGLQRFGPGWLRAVRSRWLTRRWLRKRLESYGTQDKEWHDEYHFPWPMMQESTCPLCHPQPPQSQPSSEAGAGKNGG